MKKILKNKKGFFLLGEHGVKIVVAVFAIVVLAILGFKLFNMFTQANSEVKAEDIVELVVLKTEYLRSSEYTLDYIDIILNPITGWYLKSYYIRANAPPKGECVGRFKSCLCVCNNEDCSGLKACKGIDENVSIIGVVFEDTSGFGGVGQVDYNPVFYDYIKFENSAERLRAYKTEKKPLFPSVEEGVEIRKL